jgi:hypothetical protein
MMLDEDFRDTIAPGNNLILLEFLDILTDHSEANDASIVTNSSLSEWDCLTISTSDGAFSDFHDLHVGVKSVYARVNLVEFDD